MKAATPATIADYVGAAIVAPVGYLDWLAAHLRREATLDARLADARKVCP